MSRHLPPGWPAPVPPPGTPGWQHRAVGWLLDLCPADYRGYPVLTRHPVLLAYLATRHVAAELEGVAQATAGLRHAVRDDVPPQAVDEALAVLEREQARLLQAQRAVALVADAMRGGRYVPRL